MAREYARFRLSIWDDPDFLDLSRDAQHLYMMLVSDRTLSYAGVADWRPRRLTQRASDLTIDMIMTAAAELEERRFVLFDPDTEEALVRSFIRGDEVLRNPKLALSAIKAYGATASRVLRALIVNELHRAREEQSAFSSWTSPQSREQLARLLELPRLDPVDYTNRITNPITNLKGDDIGNRNTNENGNAAVVPNAHGNGNSDPGPDYQRESVDFLPADSRQQPSAIRHGGGYVSPEAHLPGADDPPSPHCPQHHGGTTAPCRACGDARRARIEWESRQSLATHAARSAEALERAELRARAIAECALCDDDGYRDTAVCDHDPDRDAINERGRAMAREALEKARRGDA